MKKSICILLLIILIFSLSACKKEDNTSSELDTGSQSDVSIVDTSSQNNATSKEDLENGQSSSKEESKQQSSKSSSSWDKSEPTETITPSTPTHTHSFSNATCTEPKKCSCGATDGQALGHKWIDATCKAPKTCSVCKITEGNSSNHVFSDGKCIYCQEMQIINPKKGLKEHADYYEMIDKGDGHFTIWVWNFFDSLFHPTGCYSTNKEWAESEETINYKGKTFYPVGHGGPAPNYYTLTDKEIILKYDPEEFADKPEYTNQEYRLVVNYEYDLEVIYANGNFFKKGQILDLVE